MLSQRGPGSAGVFYFQIDGSGSLFLRTWNGEQTSVTSATTGMDDGVWRAYSATRNGGDHLVYINGIQDGLNNGIIRSLTGTNRIGIGYETRNDAFNFTGKIAVAGIADRAWTPGEHALFAADPFGLIRPRRPIELWSASPAAGGGGDPEGPLVGGKLVGRGILMGGRLVA
jgi:hypothetical protein